MYKDNFRHSRPVISGVNWFLEHSLTNSVITFSNIHESDQYKRDVFNDLQSSGYSVQELEKNLRVKNGFFLSPFSKLARFSGGIINYSSKQII
ncbi:hypothetical protein J4436_03350 [Candidatus Woesearchaeota archaeon]|nr:hypothetical protein [Candidatus Woesearchaeota archaeon]